VAQLTAIPSPTPARDLLTRDEARARAGRVRNAAYEIDVDLHADRETFVATTALTFDLEGVSEPLFLDFKGGSIGVLTVNGNSVDPDVRDNRLWLDPSVLEPHMSVSLAYESRFDDTGDGFHRFVDPEDGEAYVYSNFQPFAAHRLFPCFDQPDLKATYRLSVTAPGEWEVISASRPRSVESAAGGRRRHTFEETQRFSTYLLPLVAGPYEVVRTEHKGIPLGLFGRRSLARQLEQSADELFEITRQGFDYFADLFDQPYAFTKYDQLFMPEFNIGAMENVGAVTFHDSFLFRDPPTETQRLERAEVVLHELAHMWFGNLVTMRWWDDLWLNESFATYVSFLALTEATRFTGAWKTFNSSVKLSAYHADELVTTHPISADATDTETAVLNFDDITYGKGASVLKQLVATIGWDGFREGIRAYFRRYAWGTASLADFMAALEEGSGTDLGRWAALWLETASVNTIAGELTLGDGAIADLSLLQTAPAAFPTLRPHAMQLALVTERSGNLDIEAIAVKIDGPSMSVAEAKGRPAPVLVFPNHEDHDYARVLLGETSLAFARERLGELGDPLLRQLLWTSLWDMVRDARLRSTDFLEICRRILPGESDLELVDAVLIRVGRCLAEYVPGARRIGESQAVLEIALAALRKTDSPDARIVWMRAAIMAAATPADLEPLRALGDGRDVIEGFAVDQDMRWNLATKAAAYGVEDADELVAAERERDRSDRGARAVIKAAASRPTAESKAETWRRINAEGYGSYHLTRAAMQGFVWPSQRDLLLPYREPFFKELRGVFATHDHPFARSYLLNLFQDRWAEPEMLERATQLLAELDPAETTLTRQLNEEIDDLARAIRVRAYAESTG
jgi:aminopeptidase N